MAETAFFTILDRVESTNNYAMEAVRAGMAGHGKAWFSCNQSSGKGQRGNKWQSEPGKNIALSIVIQPGQFKLSHPFYLSAAIAIACYDFFSAYAGKYVSIKWPNDLYWHNKKAGGILIENIHFGKEWKWSVAGIGININQDDFDIGLKNPVSLCQVTGEYYDLIALAAELYQTVMKKITELNTFPHAALLDAYNNVLFKKHEQVRLKKANIVFETVVKEVNSNGQLITTDAIERQFDFGEVEWLL